MLAYKHTKTHHSLFKKRILDFDMLASEVGIIPALVVGFGEAATFGSATHTNMYTYIYICVYTFSYPLCWVEGSLRGSSLAVCKCPVVCFSVYAFLRDKLHWLVKCRSIGDRLPGCARPLWKWMLNNCLQDLPHGIFYVLRPCRQYGI